ncbi:MAG TPA: AAA family ATPase [Thermoanaerobaculia bacterium]
MPADLAPALERGIVHTGVAYNTYRPQQLAFLVDFALAWKRLPQTAREALLADPWQFKEMVWGVPLRAARSQREALIHLVFPDTFEDIVSQKAKRQIADRFRDLVATPVEDVDRQLEQIRRRLADAHGAGFSFYDSEVAARWQPDASKWGQFIEWARRFYRSDSFDREERDYKLAVAARVQVAREALLSGRSWREALRDAFLNPQNNLTSWQTNDRFLQWVEQAPESASQALRALWAAEGTAADRIRGFLERLPDSVVHGPGSRLTIASFLHLAHDPTSYPHYKETQFRKGCDLTGYPRPDKGADEARVYEHALRFLDQLAEEASARGLDLRDRLDAQGVLWMVVRPSPLADSFPAEERQALWSYLGRDLPAAPTVEPEPGPEPDPQRAPARTLEELADELLLDPTYLHRLDRLLMDKRQLIFHGPPGTGKTYVARALARFYAAAEAIELVQFHPSYAYEDFIEGFRPVLSGGFALREGPLKRLARRAAAHPDVRHFLLIDEINRGNVAKVFGELYFLLEYRQEEIRLQYSDELFSLPSNLYVFATMNTADRSIALVDLALRRRFYFIPFFPDEPPVQGLLRRWLRRHRPQMEVVADLVDRANELLANRHAAIGPSCRSP